MLHAPDLDQITQRLERVDLEEWGPDGIRYVCILFWNELGYRLLRNSHDADAWERWSHSSGEFWDLFLAGCYRYQSTDAYGDRAVVLANGQVAPHRVPFFWSKRQSEMLARDIAGRAQRAGTVPPWDFTGPIDLVAIGARRSARGEVNIDWSSLRATTIRPSDLGEAVGYYTEAHLSLDADVVPASFPTPGDFQDDSFRELLRDLRRRLPLLGKLLHNLE